MLCGKRIAYMPTGSLARMELDALCALLKNIGYDGVEWTQHFANPYRTSLKDRKKLLSVPEKHGLSVSEIVVQQDLVVADEAAWRRNIDYVLRCIEAYSEIGITVINLFSGPIPWQTNRLIIGETIQEGKAWELLFRAFDEILPHAERYGVDLAVENVWMMLCHDYISLSYLLNRYDSKHLGVNYDPSHDVLAGHMDVGWVIRQWGKERIKHVHLKDAAGVQGMQQFIFPLLGEGMVDWAAFIAAIEQIGYEGYLSVEFESFAYVDRIWKGDWEQAARNAYQNCIALFA